MAMAENVKDKKSISSDSESEGNQFRKEESPLYQPEAGGGAGGAAATNPGNPKGNEASGNEKKARLIRLIIAIVGLALAVVALIPSILCSLLWWYWIWVLTVPGLILGICGLVLVFLNKKEAPLVCAGIAIIISLSAIIWGSVEVGLANSYQGPSNMKDVKIPETGQGACRGMEPSDKTKKIELIQVNDTMLPTDKLEKAFYYHMLGRYCEGRAYDWSFRKAQIQEVMSCKRETEDWFLEKILQKSDSRFRRCETKHAYEGVDSYSESPIYQTHKDRIDRNQYAYNSDKLEEEQQKELEKFCKDFDTKEFTEKREKCDEEIEKKLKPKCKPKKGGLFFTKFDMDWKIFEGFSNSKKVEDEEKKKLTFQYQLEEKFDKCGKSVRTCYNEVGGADVKEKIFRVYHFSKYNFKYLVKEDEPKVLKALEREQKNMLETAISIGEVFEKIKFLDKKVDKVDGFVEKGMAEERSGSGPGTSPCELKKKYIEKKQEGEDGKKLKLKQFEGKLKGAETMKAAMEKSKEGKSQTIKDWLDAQIKTKNIEITDKNKKISDTKKEKVCCFWGIPGASVTDPCCSGCTRSISDGFCDAT